MATINERYPSKHTGETIDAAVDYALGLRRDGLTDRVDTIEERLDADERKAVRVRRADGAGQLADADGDIIPRTTADAVTVESAGGAASQSLTAYLAALTATLQGKGEAASADKWPMRHLGDFTDMDSANIALNQAYAATSPEWQGQLRLHRGGQMVIVHQYALDYSKGRWMQVAFGPVIPSADGSALVKFGYDRFRVCYRLRTEGVAVPWTDFSTAGLDLKTVNGQSLIGSGDIAIGGSGGTVAVDAALDATSANAVANKVVAALAADLRKEMEADKELSDVSLRPVANAVLKAKFQEVEDSVTATDTKATAATDKVAEAEAAYAAQAEAILAKAGRIGVTEGYALSVKAPYELVESGNWLVTDHIPVTPGDLVQGTYGPKDTNVAWLVGYDSEGTAIWGHSSNWTTNANWGNQYTIPAGKTATVRFCYHKSCLATRLFIKGQLVFQPGLTDIAPRVSEVAKRTATATRVEIEGQGATEATQDIGKLVPGRRYRLVLDGTEWLDRSLGNNGTMFFFVGFVRSGSSYYYEVQRSYVQVMARVPLVKEYEFVAANNTSCYVGVIAPEGVTVGMTLYSPESDMQEALWTIQAAQELAGEAAENAAIEARTAKTGAESLTAELAGYKTATDAEISDAKARLDDLEDTDDAISARVSTLETAAKTAVTAAQVEDIAREVAEASGAARRDTATDTAALIATQQLYDSRDRNPDFYPEHYLDEGVTPVYCPEYWKWPLVWYKDTVDIAEEDLEEYNAKEVKFPSQWVNSVAQIYTDIYDAGHYTTHDVYYNTATKAFVLKDPANGKYFKQWANSDRWNDANTATPRADTLYSQIINQASVPSVTLRWADGEWKSIIDGITDFAGALIECIKATGGNVRLTPGVTYYANLATLANASPFSGLSGFVFDGQGASIFARTPNARAIPADGKPAEDTPAVFNMHAVSDAVFRRVGIRSIRDNTNGTTSGIRAFLADARAVAFGVFGCQDMRFEDIECTSLGHDFNCKRCLSTDTVRGIVIDGWTSDDFTQNFFGNQDGLTIRRATLRQSPFSCTAHMLYITEKLKDVLVEDSELTQGSPWSSAMVQMKTENQSTAAGPGGVTFRRCDIRGGWAMIARHPYVREWYTATFEDCCLTQTWRTQYDSTTGGMLDMDGQGIAFLQVTCGCDIVLRDCRATLLRPLAKIDRNDIDKASALSVSGGQVTLDSPERAFCVSYAAKPVAKGLATNYTGDRIDMQPASAGEVADTVEMIGQSLAALTNTVTGADVAATTEGAGAPTSEAGPVDPAVGDVYTDTTTGYLWKCTSAGEKGSWSIQMSNVKAGTYDFRLTLTLNKWESVTVYVEGLSLNQEAAADRAAALVEAVRAKLEEQGYTATPKSTYYLRVYAKSGGLMTPKIGYTNTGSTPTFSRSASTAANYYTAGADPAWERVEAGGLTAQVATLESQVASLEAKAVKSGATTARPAEGVTVGQCFFDATLGKPVWAAHVQTTTSTDPQTLADTTTTTVKWVDATGEEV